MLVQTRNRNQNQNEGKVFHNMHMHNSKLADGAISPIFQNWVTYRPDLPEIEKTKKGSRKRKLTSCLDTDNEQPTKK